VIYPSVESFRPSTFDNINVTANGARGMQLNEGLLIMKIQARTAVAVLSSLACFSYVSNVTAAGVKASSQLSANKQRPPSNIYDPTGLVSASRQGQLVTLATGFGFTEGPAVDRHGNVFFTDQPNDRIYRWDAGTSKVTLFLQGTGRSNGMAFDKGWEPHRLCGHAWRSLEDPNGWKP
jgi:hypothetical protein